MGSKSSKTRHPYNAYNPFVYTGDPIPDLTENEIDECMPSSLDKYATIKKNHNKPSYEYNSNLYKTNDSETVRNNRIIRRYKSLKDLSEVIMFGYVRTHCLIALEKMPTDIINLVLLFYACSDEWDTQASDQRLIIDEKGNISKPKKCTDISRFYAFGRDHCEKGQRRLWKFKIIEKDERYKRLSMSIGVIKTSVIRQGWNTRWYESNR